MAILSSDTDCMIAESSGVLAKKIGRVSHAVDRSQLTVIRKPRNLKLRVLFFTVNCPLETVNCETRPFIELIRLSTKAA